MFNFRYSTASTRESLAQRLGRRTAHAMASTTTLAWTGHRRAVPDAARAARRRRRRRSIREVTGIEPELSCTGGTSDGRFIARICPEIVEIGPVNATIHKLNERVAMADLESARGHLSAASSSGCWRPPDESARRSSKRCATGCATRCRASTRRPCRSATASTNAYDEAAYLLLHALHLPLDRLEPFLDAKLTQAERDELAQLFDAAHRRARAGGVPHARSVARRIPLPCRRARDHPALVHRRTDAGGPRTLRFGPVDESSRRSIFARAPVASPILLAHAFRMRTSTPSTSVADALAVAQRNVSDYGLAGRINLIRSDLFDNLPEKCYDLIISNPPYVTAVGDGGAAARIPARAGARARRRRRRPRRGAHDPAQGAAIHAARTVCWSSRSATTVPPPRRRFRGCRSSG